MQENKSIALKYFIKYVQWQVHMERTEQILDFSYKVKIEDIKKL